MAYQAEQTGAFSRAVKKLKSNQKKDLDTAIKAILKDPSIGALKVADLSGVCVYKFRMVNQLTLVAYQIYEERLVLKLLKFGPHENFYDELKRQLN